MGKGKESNPTDASAITLANALVDSRPTVVRKSANRRPTVDQLVDHVVLADMSPQCVRRRVGSVSADVSVMCCVNHKTEFNTESDLLTE